MIGNAKTAALQDLLDGADEVDPQLNLIKGYGETHRRGKANFLKLRVSLEVDDKTYETRIKDVMPRIKDNFQVFLRELRADDLSGSAGLYRVAGQEHAFFRQKPALMWFNAQI